MAALIVIKHICLILACSKSTEKKRKHSSLDLPDGSGWGDHIQLLQIYEHWDQTDYSINWCKDNNLQVLFLKVLFRKRTQYSCFWTGMPAFSLVIRYPALHNLGGEMKIKQGSGSVTKWIKISGNKF